MKNKYVIYIILLLFISINIFLRVYPYVVYKYDFLIGFDSGKYVDDFRNSDSTSLDKIDLWVEPGLNTNLTVLNALVNLNPQLYFKYLLPSLFAIYSVLLVFLFSRRHNKSSIAYITSLIFFTTSPILLNSTFDSFYRQILATMIYLTFLYFIEPSIKNSQINLRTIIVSAILGAGIIMTHRAIALLFVITLFFIFWSIFRKNKKESIKIAVLLLIALSLSSIYWLTIIKDNILILRDTLLFSFEGNSGGERVIKSLTRDDNQILGYIINYAFPASLIILSLIVSFVRRKFPLLFILSSFLILYIYFKATFANRFLFNLELFFAILIGSLFVGLNETIGKKMISILITVYFVTSFIYSIAIINARQPYIPKKTSSLEWLEKNIDADTSLIIAPAPLATIFTSIGYKTSIYEFPLKIGQKDDRIPKTELFLLNGDSDITLIKSLPTKYKNVYVVIGEWYLHNPLSRIDKSISLTKWEESKYFSEIYEGDGYIYRIFRLNKLNQ